LAGSAQEQIAQARGYRTSVVENAKANADYLRNILPQYQKRPQLVLQKIYQDTVENVLDNADEKIVLQPSAGKSREVRIQVNRDPKAKPKVEEKK
jgi:membrane protease subunit HflK